MSYEAANPQDIKLGSVQPHQGLAEIRHSTADGEEVRIGGLIDDPDDPEAKLGTLYRFNRHTGETATEHGKIRGAIRESAHYVWEHRKGAAAITSFAVSVTLGSLWIRHRNHKG